MLRDLSSFLPSALFFFLSTSRETGFPKKSISQLFFRFPFSVREFFFGLGDFSLGEQFPRQFAASAGVGARFANHSSARRGKAPLPPTSSRRRSPRFAATSRSQSPFSSFLDIGLRQRLSVAYPRSRTLSSWSAANREPSTFASPLPCHAYGEHLMRSEKNLREIDH